MCVIEMGVDVVGGILYYENICDKGVSLVMFLMDFVQCYGCLVDVYCDEIDDLQLCFFEVLVEEVWVCGMGVQVIVSYICVMGFYDNVYCLKLFCLLKVLGINFIFCLIESIYLQGWFDSWLKWCGVIWVVELDCVGINVCFVQDLIQDLWYLLGNGNILCILDVGLYICYMFGYDDLQCCFDFVIDNSVWVLCLGDNYGFVEGCLVNLLIFDVENDYEVVCCQVWVLIFICYGKVILQCEVEYICYLVQGVRCCVMMFFCDIFLGSVCD